MARCAYCETETQLYENEVPICLVCSNEPPARRQAKLTLFRDLTEATKRADAALDAFAAVTRDIPTGYPHPDGLQRIQNASREMQIARKEMMKAHSRLNDFLTSGIVPEDLKQAGGNSK